jgi:hypothetical protein
MAVKHLDFIRSFKGQAGVVRIMVNETLLFSILISLTISRVTKSFLKSGSSTVLKAFNTSFSVMVQFFVKKEYCLQI